MQHQTVIDEEHGVAYCRFKKKKWVAFPEFLRTRMRWWPNSSCGRVVQLFPQCSLNVPWMFLECSLTVPWMFPGMKIHSVPSVPSVPSVSDEDTHIHSLTSCRFLAQLQLVIFMMEVLCEPRGNTWWTRSSTPGISCLLMLNLVLGTHVGNVVFCINLGTFFKCFLQLGLGLTGVHLDSYWMFLESLTTQMRWWPKSSRGRVVQMFLDCSLSVPWVFPECSLNVPESLRTRMRWWPPS
jgi:hypothetical protein